MCIRGIGETMIDSGIREASDGMGELLSPRILGKPEATSSHSLSLLTMSWAGLKADAKKRARAHHEG